MKEGGDQIRGRKCRDGYGLKLITKLKISTI